MGSTAGRDAAESVVQGPRNSGAAAISIEAGVAVGGVSSSLFPLPSSEASGDATQVELRGSSRDFAAPQLAVGRLLEQWSRISFGAEAGCLIGKKIAYCST